MSSIKFFKEIGFSASPYASNNFGKAVMFRIYKLIQVYRAYSDSFQ